MTNVLSLTTTAWRSFYETQCDALETRNVDVTTLEPPNEFRAFEDEVRRRSLRDYLRFQLSVLRASTGSYDLVHANYGLTAPSALAQPIRPVIVTLWGGEFIGNRFERIIRAAIRLADEVVVPSAAMGRRVNRDHHVVPFPVDTDLFEPIPQDRARRYLGWEPDPTVVLFPSAKARYEKNYPLAERVVDQLPMDAELRAVANEPYEDMPYYLNASDAMLVTSRWESGPMVVKEAMACNVPVVSTHVGFVPDVLQGVSNSRVARSESDLASALGDVLRAGDRSDGREQVIGYGHREMGDRLLEVYEQAMTGRSAVVSLPRRVAGRS